MVQLEDLVDLRDFDPARLYVVIRNGNRLFALNLTERSIRDFNGLEHQVFIRTLKPLEKAIGEVIRVDKDELLLPLGGKLAQLGKALVHLPKELS